MMHLKTKVPKIILLALAFLTVLVSSVYANGQTASAVFECGTYGSGTYSQQCEEVQPENSQATAKPTSVQGARPVSAPWQPAFESGGDESGPSNTVSGEGAVSTPQSVDRQGDHLIARNEKTDDTSVTFQQVLAATLIVTGVAASLFVVTFLKRKQR